MQKVCEEVIGLATLLLSRQVLTRTVVTYLGHCTRYHLTPDNILATPSYRLPQNARPQASLHTYPFSNSPDELCRLGHGGRDYTDQIE